MPPDWPVLPDEWLARYAEIDISPLYVSLDCVHFYAKPDDMTLTEFLEELKGDGQQGG